MFIAKQSYATKKTMTNFSHRWLMPNSNTIKKQMICSYYQQPDSSLDHYHFLTYLESGERKDVRKQGFRMLIDQLKSPTTLTNELLRGIYSAYRKRKEASSFSTEMTQKYNRMGTLHSRDNTKGNNTNHDNIL